MPHKKDNLLQHCYKENVYVKLMTLQKENKINMQIERLNKNGKIVWKI